MAVFTYVYYKSFVNVQNVQLVLANLFALDLEHQQEVRCPLTWERECVRACERGCARTHTHMLDPVALTRRHFLALARRSISTFTDTFKIKVPCPNLFLFL